MGNLYTHAAVWDPAKTQIWMKSTRRLTDLGGSFLDELYFGLLLTLEAVFDIYMTSSAAFPSLTATSDSSRCSLCAFAAIPEELGRFRISESEESSRFPSERI